MGRSYSIIQYCLLQATKLQRDAEGICIQAICPHSSPTPQSSEPRWYHGKWIWNALGSLTLTKRIYFSLNHCRNKVLGRDRNSWSNPRKKLKTSGNRDHTCSSPMASTTRSLTPSPSRSGSTTTGAAKVPLDRWSGSRVHKTFPGEGERGESRLLSGPAKGSHSSSQPEKKTQKAEQGTEASPNFSL